MTATLHSGPALPAVSVVIPAYNAAPFIAEAVNSVLAQTFSDPVEIIVINDGSPDTPSLEEALERFGVNVTYVRQENRGASSARNHGVRISRGEFVAFLDADDKWLPEYLETLVGALRADPSVHVMYANPLLFGEGTSAGKSFMDVSPSDGDVTFEKLVRLECNVSSSVTARRETLLTAGLFDESLATAEDFDLWLRIVKHGSTIGFTRQTLLHVRVRAGSLSSNKHWMYRDFLKVLDKSERTQPLSDAERKAIIDMRANYQARIALHEGRMAFFNGDTRTAVQRIGTANAYFRSMKLSAVILALRLFPRLLLTTYRMRDLLVFGTNTRS